MLVMENFEMMPGDLESPCTNSDYVKIKMPEGSENVNIDKLCGDNNDQHLYVHFPNTTEEKTVTIKIMAKKSSQYRIKIHQVSNLISWVFTSSLIF